MDSAELARWWADTEAKRVQDAVTQGLLCDRCGRHRNGISRYLYGWLCDPCINILERAAMRVTYETARHIHEGWYGEDDDTVNSDTDDPWEVLSCGHMRGELHDCTGDTL